MTEEYYTMAETYKKLAFELHDADRASLSIKSCDYFEAFCRFKQRSAYEADEKFMLEYYLRWLPYAICFDDDYIIEGLFEGTRCYMEFIDMMNIHNIFEIITNLGIKVKSESERLMKLKRSIKECNNSFIISLFPCIIDLEKYRLKKSSVDSDTVRDKGLFVIQEKFPSNSVVMKKLGFGEYFIRLYFNEKTVELIKDGDVFDISILRQNGKWVLDDIRGCFNINRKEYENGIKCIV